MQTFSADGDMRLDVSLARKGIVSRMQARDLVKSGCVLVNGRMARKPALLLAPGDEVSVSVSGEPLTEKHIAPASIDLPVLYEDDACMVIDKPAGIPVHPGAGMPKNALTILHGIVRLFHERNIPFSSSIVLVHRLDKDTTGCLLIAKTHQVHKALQEQFANRSVAKTYLALVAGIPNPSAAVIDATIGRSVANRTKMTVLGAGKAREAKTTYRTLASGAESALLACELHTGRTHQIRVHLNAIGHPILGDPSYGSRMSERLSMRLSVDSICLHAWKLSFISPADGTVHHVIAPMPARLADALQRAGLQGVAN